MQIQLSLLEYLELQTNQTILNLQSFTKHHLYSDFLPEANLVDLFALRFESAKKIQILSDSDPQYWFAVFGFLRNLYLFWCRNMESPKGNGDKGWEEGDGWEVDPLGDEIEVLIFRLVGFGLACAPVRRAHPSLSAHQHT